MPIVSNIALPSNANIGEVGTESNIPDVLDRNWQTTAAATLAVATGGVTGAIMLSAFPAQTLTTGAAIGGLAVAGQRRADGKEPMFGLIDRMKKLASKKEEAVADKPAEPVAAEKSEEPAVEPAAA